MKTKADYMIISAHPDDAEFGVAGSVAQWTADGKQVVYVICTNGDKGSSDPDMKPQQLAQIREEEQRQAAARLGVHEVEFLRYPDQGLEDTPDFRKHIVRMIRLYRPDIIVTSDPYRKYIWHRDHRITGQVTLDAVFPYARDHMAYPDLMEEGILPHKVKEIWFWGSEDINLRLDITGFMDTKLAALFCHTSQMASMGAENVEAWIKHKCREMAEATGFTYAEGFHQVKIPY
ncbi:MAG: PIG-L family deacetylase [Desulfobacteraceae bacterium]|nr:MAG: PIG-L family deacetylase [Desulfobacteraceae bacterium]